ncbi:hypothetical protein ACOSQ3_019985 [Xanthoceras sorbifolium]
MAFPPHTPCPSLPSPWSPPPVGELKLNDDVAIKPDSSMVDAGTVVRDRNILVVVALAKPLWGFFNSELGELLAIREGLLFAKSLKLFVSWVEVEASSVVARLQSSSSSCLADPIVCNIKALFKDVEVSNCLSIPRSRNVVAHSLTSLAFSSKEERTWFDPKLVFLVDLL